MSVTAEDWENRKPFNVQRVKVHSVLEGGQGCANIVPLINVATTVNNLFHLALKKRYLTSRCAGKEFIL